jgi:hypothetical protein
MLIDNIWLRTDADGKIRVLFQEPGSTEYRVAIETPHVPKGEGIISHCAHHGALEIAKPDPITSQPA